MKSVLAFSNKQTRPPSSDSRKLQKRGKRNPRKVRAPSSSLGGAAGAIRMASSAYAMVQRLAQFVNVEYKYYGANGTGGIDYSGTLSAPLNIPAQGLTQVTRNGDSIKCSVLDFSFAVRLAAGALGSAMRIILVWDKNNALTIPGDVLDGSYLGSTYAPLSPYYVDKAAQYDVLFDRTITVSSTGDSYLLGTSTVQLERHTIFTAGTTTPTVGALRLLLLSNEVANKPNIDWVVRTFFIDN